MGNCPTLLSPIKDGDEDKKFPPPTTNSKSFYHLQQDPDRDRLLLHPTLRCEAIIRLIPNGQCCPSSSSSSVDQKPSMSNYDYLKKEQIFNFETSSAHVGDLLRSLIKEEGGVKSEFLSSEILVQKEELKNIKITIKTKGHDLPVGQRMVQLSDDGDDDNNIFLKNLAKMVESNQTKNETGRQILRLAESNFSAEHLTRISHQFCVAHPQIRTKMVEQNYVNSHVEGKLDKIRPDSISRPKMDKIVPDPKSKEKFEKVIPDPKSKPKIDKIISDPKSKPKIDKIIPDPKSKPTIYKAVVPDSNPAPKIDKRKRQAELDRNKLLKAAMMSKKSKFSPDQIPPKTSQNEGDGGIGYSANKYFDLFGDVLPPKSKTDRKSKIGPSGVSAHRQKLRELAQQERRRLSSGVMSKRPIDCIVSAEEVQNVMWSIEQGLNGPS